MYAARCVKRALPRFALHVHHILGQKPLMKTRQMPMFYTFRYLGAKDGGKPPVAAAGGGGGVGKEPAAPAGGGGGKEPAAPAGGGGGMQPAPDGGGAAVVEMTPPAVILKIIKARIVPELSYDDRNMRLGRVMSPALTIYKKQLTSVLSILLRMSGFALTLFVWGLGLTGLFSKRTLAEWAEKVNECDVRRNVVSGMKFVMIFPFVYHVVAGTRHLIWHLDVFLTKPQIYATGYLAVVLTFVLAGGLTMLNVGEEVKKDVVDMTDEKQYKQKKAEEKKKAEEEAKAKAKMEAEKKAQEKALAKEQKKAQAKEADGKAKEPPK
ncbi:uncharacterized protein SdhCL [Drosophila pseudoobscura]|uniref:Uncharacterized protein SdhCL n=1 Tax=Drosophila pseudoobscura pseudoobscura TaxID=46245 RepID=A0A6I8VN74_DROPS|nr:uncharacterized protein LOC6899191 [Drosophila pseudoobscura]